MAQRSVEVRTKTKVRNALNGLTFEQKIRVIAYALQEAGLPMMGAQLLVVLNSMDKGR